MPDQNNSENSAIPMPLSDFKFPEKTIVDGKESDENEGQSDYIYQAPSIAPVVSLHQGLAKKATPLALSSWVKLALSLDGRDKITKICQYSARLLAWWFIGTSQANRFKSTQTSLTTSRKAYRLGRSLIEIQKIRDSGFLDIIFGSPGSCKKKDPAWQIVGSAMKMIGLLGFWAGDNVNFLAGSGLFDNYREGVGQKERMAQRNQLKTQASLFANRSYFFGCLAGLVTSLRSYWTHRNTSIREANARLLEATHQIAKADRTEDEASKHKMWKDAKVALDKAKQKQFSLFLALLKVRFGKREFPYCNVR